MSQVPAHIPEPQRRSGAREDHVPEFGALVLWEQRQLFTQLLNDQGREAGHGTSRAGAPANGDLSMVEALSEQLVPRLQGASTWPLTAVLYVPRLGRINASIRRERTGWNIELEAEQEATTSWLNGMRERCEQRLTASLALPVALRVASSASA